MISTSTMKRRQQGVDGAMFRTAIINNESVGPFNVGNGIKINSETCNAF